MLLRNLDRVEARKIENLGRKPS